MEGRRPDGFGLVDTLCALAIIALVAGWAVPSFRTLALDAVRARQVNGFVQAVHLARSEAISRNAVVSLCPTPDGATCAAGPAWNIGWMVFANDDRDSPADRDPGEARIRVFPAWPEGSVVSNRGTLSFRAFGQSGVTATVTFCDRRGRRAARAVVISQTGRPRVTDRSSAGGPLACP